ncbi:unnamed protein product [Closterium sp. Yama58-4]|nr:unnamed protein product [Closterium sp. Yama58-4]
MDALHLVNRVLDLAKLEAGKAVVDETSITVREWLHAALEWHVEEAHSKGIEFLSIVDDNVPGHIIADQMHLSKMLKEILDNAVRFTEQGRVTVRVSLVPRGTSLQDALYCQGLSTPASHTPASSLASWAAVWFSSKWAWLYKALRELPAAAAAAASASSASSSPSRDRPAVLVVSCRDSGCGLPASLLGVHNSKEPSHFSLAELHEAGSGSGASLGLVLMQQMVSAHAADGECSCSRCEGDCSRALERTAERESVRKSSSGDYTRPVSANAATGASAICGSFEHLRADEAVTRAWVGGLRVLVVDDTPVNLLVARRSLARWGAHVTTASRGEQALELITAGVAEGGGQEEARGEHAVGEEARGEQEARGQEEGGALLQHGFDLVLMDLQMPGMDGFAAAAAIRALERKVEFDSIRPVSLRVPIVALTADVDRGVVQRCAEGGFDGVLQKPVDAHLLAAHLSHMHPQRSLLRVVSHPSF